MKYRNTNKHIFTVIFALCLVVVCCACIVSCGDGDTNETLYPEYTGDIWTFDVDSDHQHETQDIDNFIDFSDFTTGNSNEIIIPGVETTVSDTPVIDGTVSTSAPVEDDETEKTSGVEGTEGIKETVELTHSPNHAFPEDEYDISGYQTLIPVTTMPKN